MPRFSAAAQTAATRARPRWRRRWCALRGRLDAGLGAGVYAAAPWLWIAQAGLLAYAVEQLTQAPEALPLLGLALAYAVVGGVRATAEAWAQRRLFRAAQAHVSCERSRACAALAASSPLDRTRASSGHAASAMAEQADALLPWQLRYRPALVRVVLVPAAIALAVAYFSWLSALILLLAAPLIPMAMVWIGWRAQAASQAQLQSLGSMQGFLLDRLRGLATLRALGAVETTALRLRAWAQEVRQRTMQVLRIAFLSSAALELFSALAVALVAVYIGFHLLGELPAGSWGQRLSLGEGLFILLLAPAFFEPLRELATAWHDKAAGQAAEQALHALQCSNQRLPLPGVAQELAHAPAPAASDAPPATTPATLDLDNLSVGYCTQAPVLERVHLHVAAGEHIALVGASGCGKSTLLATIAGLLPACAGTVRIGSTPLEGRHAHLLRRRMAWIGQKPHIFCGTVQDNVALHRPEVGHGHVLSALHQAGLAPSARIAPSTPLGEGGQGLSGGEAMRLALARAVAMPQADIWLLDEPTAHLDRDTAQALVDALLQLAQGRTLVVATHDGALAARMDRIVDVRTWSAA